MPVQMVCDSTSLVSAALRDSLTSAGGTSSAATSSGAISSSSLFAASSSGSAFLDSSEKDLGIESNLSLIIERSQLPVVRYELAPSSTFDEDSIKSKCIVLKTTDGTNGINGTSSIGGAGPANGSTTNTSAPLMNGGNSNSTMMTKSVAADSTSHGPATSSGGSMQQNGGGNSSTASGKDQLPTPRRVLFPRENVQLGWKATGRKWTVGSGMTNVGNTCYLNSTLQALFHVPAIVNWLVSDAQHREHCEESSGPGCIICAMAKTLLVSQSSPNPIKPMLVYSKLRQVCKHLVPGRQEDAHEFLRYLVEAMEKSYLGRFKNSKDLDQYTKETTPLNQILGGYLRSEVKCLSCNHISTTFQHFEDLLLDIRKANSIEEGLDVYFSREKLEEMQYKCEACKKRVAATKQFSLERAPFALCIQLKRFSMLGGKINKRVELSPRLDLTPYSSKSSSSSGKLTYKLVSMITHLGNSQHCGHYTAIGGTENGYYVFDDSSVRQIAMQNVINTDAYIIFYELEGVQNGMKTSASSTATSASFAAATTTSTTASYFGKNGSGAGAGSSGLAPHASTLRTMGPSSNFNNGPQFPSKLENQQPGSIIGPMLPQQTQEKGKKFTNGLSCSYPLLANDDSEEESAGNPAPVSPSTSSLSSPSPVKMSNSWNSPSGSKLVKNPASQCSPNVKNKPGLTSTSSNGIVHANTSNSSYKISSTLSSSSASSLLPSMPKLCNSPTAAKSTNGTASGSEYGPNGKAFASNGLGGKRHLTNGYAGNKSVSLVPYDDDNDEDDEDEDSAAGKKLKRYTNGDRAIGNESDDDEAERSHSNGLLGPGSKKRLRLAEEEDSSCSPKSPPVIKTNAGVWKVTENRQQTSSSSSASSSKSASPATSGNSSPANYNHTNGNGNGNGYGNNARYQPNNERQCNGNYNNNNSNGHNRNNDVTSHLKKFSHQGYGAPVFSWNGHQTQMDREMANERREDLKRQIEDDRETEMDRGRTKKMKNNSFLRDSNGGGPQSNAFQNFQNQKNGGGNHFNRNHFNNNNNNNNNGYNNGYGGNKNGNDRYYQNRRTNGYQNHGRNHHTFRHGYHPRHGYYNKSNNHHQRDNGNGNNCYNR